jgi:hypothetical protein
MSTDISYHPDPEINAVVAADALDAERADLAAGYPPRRWQCPCGAQHSRGHFGVIGVHRCLSCGYTGTEGVMILDDAEGVRMHDAGATPVTCPPSAVADQIITWAELEPGDLFVHEESWAVATEVITYESDWQGHKWMRTEILYREPECFGDDAPVRTHATDKHSDRLVAVRRYVTGG